MVKPDPDFVGFVTAIDRAGTGEVIGRITVESHADKLVDRHFITLTNNTMLLRRDGKALLDVANFVAHLVAQFCVEVGERLVEQ